jgi:hypothetical protein
MIFSRLLFFSETVFSCTVHHRGWVCSCCSQILWIVHTMRDFRVRFERVSLMCDNTSAISVAKNPVFQKNETCWEETPLSKRSCREEGYWDVIYRHRETVSRHFHQTLWFFSIYWFAGGIGVYHPYDLVWGKLVLLSCILYILLFSYIILILT